MNEERLDENIVEVKEETTEETMAEESQEGKAAEPVDIEKKIAELEDDTEKVTNLTTIASAWPGI